MLFDILSLLTGAKLETTGNAKQTLTQNVKIAHTVIGTTQLVMKYCLEKMVFSANKRVGMKVILGLHIRSYKWDIEGSMQHNVGMTEH